MVVQIDFRTEKDRKESFPSVGKFCKVGNNLGINIAVLCPAAISSGKRHVSLPIIPVRAKGFYEWSEVKTYAKYFSAFDFLF